MGIVNDLIVSWIAFRARHTEVRLVHIECLSKFVVEIRRFGLWWKTGSSYGKKAVFPYYCVIRHTYINEEDAKYEGEVTYSLICDDLEKQKDARIEVVKCAKG